MTFNKLQILFKSLSFIVFFSTEIINSVTHDGAHKDVPSVNEHLETVRLIPSNYATCDEAGLFF